MDVSQRLGSRCLLKNIFYVYSINTMNTRRLVSSTPTLHVLARPRRSTPLVFCASTLTCFADPEDDPKRFNMKQFDQQLKLRKQVSRLNALIATSHSANDMKEICVDDIVQVMMKKWGRVRELVMEERHGSLIVLIQGCAEENDAYMHEICCRLNETGRGALFLSQLSRMDRVSNMDHVSIVLDDIQQGSRASEWNV